MYLRQDKLDILINYWLEKQAEMEQQILELYSKEAKEIGLETTTLIPELSQVFDLSSPAQKLEALRMLGFELNDTKRETLLSIQHPIAKLLGEYSNVTKWTSTYGENMREKINATTGMWHPRFAQMGSGEMEAASGRDNTTTTATGRFVSDAQQFPRKMERFGKLKDKALEKQVLDHFLDQISQMSEASRKEAA